MSQVEDRAEDFCPLPVELPKGVTKARGRRISVSAEADRVAAHHQKIVIPKPADAVARIRTAVAKSFLFSGLEKEQMQDILNAMREMHVEPGHDVIKENAYGDYFYVIESGTYDVLKKIDGKEAKVFDYDNNGTFGELALMYNCPRAATVRATSAGIVWALDRATFRQIIIESTRERKEAFEGFLSKVNILANLSAPERSKIADCLESRVYADGEIVIKQGDEGDAFYLVEQGVALARQNGVEVGRITAGQYFGERALITREPRAADVYADGELRAAIMDRAAFERLLGDCKEIMQRQIKGYKTAEEVVAAEEKEESV